MFIGYFDLDPTRVLDLILAVMVKSSEEHGLCLLSLIGDLAYPAISVAAMLGRLREYGEERVWLVMALCLRANLTSLSLLLPYLHNTPLPNAEQWMEAIAAERGGPLTETEAVVKEDKAEEEKGKEERAKKPATPPPPPLASGPTIRDPLVFISKHAQTDCQVAQLLAACLRVGAMEAAELLLARYPGIGLVLPAVGRWFCHQLGQRLDADGLEVSWLLWWTGQLGPQLHHQPALISRLCRLAVPEDPRWQEVIRTVLLPSLQLSLGQPALSFDLFSLLSRMPLGPRWTLLMQAESDKPSKPPLQLAHRLALQDLKRMLRRLAKENVKQYSRWLAKLMHSQPLACLRLLLEQAMAYDNMVLPLVDALRYATPLTIDCLGVQVLTLLSQTQQEAMKADGVNVAQWLQSLALFVAALARRLSTDPAMGDEQADWLNAILRWLCTRLSQGQASELAILAALLQRLAGLEPRPEYGEHLAGGPELRRRCRPASTMPRVSRRALGFLWHALGDLRVPLWVALGAARRLVLRESIRAGSDWPTRLTASLLDQCRLAFNQYGDYMRLVGEELNLPQDNLPGVEELLGEYGLSREAAHAMHRRLVPNIAECASMEQIFWQLSLPHVHCPLNLYAQHADLASEQHEQQVFIQRVAIRIREFAVDWNGDADSFIRQCVLPRLLARPDDAVYAAHFVLKLPPFVTQMLPRLYALVGQVAAELTELEAYHLGLFIQTISQREDDGMESGEMVEEDQTLHEQLTADLLQLLKAEEHGPMKNGLILLTHVTHGYPHWHAHGRRLLRRVTEIREQGRQDLRVMATRCQAMLNQLSTGWLRLPTDSPEADLMEIDSNCVSAEAERKEEEGELTDKASMEIDTNLSRMALSPPPQPANPPMIEAEQLMRKQLEERRKERFKDDSPKVETKSPQKRTAEDDREMAKRTRDQREGRQQRDQRGEARDTRVQRDMPREIRDHRLGREMPGEVRDQREGREMPREIRDQRDHRDLRDVREIRDLREARDSHERELRSPRDTRRPDSRDGMRDLRDRDNRDSPRDARVSPREAPRTERPRDSPRESQRSARRR